MDFLAMSSIILLLETFLLISLRLFGFFVVVPVFGGQTTNSSIKIMISMTTAFIIMTTQNIVSPLASGYSFVAFFIIGVKELAVGLLLGFSIYFLLSMFYYVGQLVDFQIGFSMVSVYDPINQMQIPITGNLFYLCVSLLLVLTGAHYNFFRALFYSYTVLPIGESIIFNEKMAQTVVSLFSTFFLMGFRTSLPIIGTMLIIEIALGLLNKAAPQMHIFSVGMSLKIIVGLALVFLLMPLFNTISAQVFTEINKTLYTLIRGMMP